MERHITLPLTREEARTIKSGEQLLLSGVIYTARDAAHKRLCELVEKGEPLPFDVKNATIYYVGPTPAKPGQVIGSAGPTTSYRMDAYSPTLIREGETGMIGKGKRNAEVIGRYMERISLCAPLLILSFLTPTLSIRSSILV